MAACELTEIMTTDANLAEHSQDKDDPGEVLVEQTSLLKGKRSFKTKCRLNKPLRSRKTKFYTKWRLNKPLRSWGNQVLILNVG